jgi:hypothetical protein
MTCERCRVAHHDTKRTLAVTWAQTTRAPTLSPLCEWCPFNGIGSETLLDEETKGLG